jgi:hypothetical protein
VKKARHGAPGCLAPVDAIGRKVPARCRRGREVQAARRVVTWVLSIMGSRRIGQPEPAETRSLAGSSVRWQTPGPYSPVTLRAPEGRSGSVRVLPGLCITSPNRCARRVALLRNDAIRPFVARSHERHARASMARQSGTRDRQPLDKPVRRTECAGPYEASRLAHGVAGSRILRAREPMHRSHEVASIESWFLINRFSACRYDMDQGETHSLHHPCSSGPHAVRAMSRTAWIGGEDPR